jgi:hypothetical protein
VVGSENGEIGKGFREMLRPAKDGAIPLETDFALLRELLAARRRAGLTLARALKAALK